MKNQNRSWLLRGKPSGVDREKEFYENSFFATGWGNTGDLSGLSRDDIVDKLSNDMGYRSYSPRKIGITSSVLNYIVNDIVLGDYTLMADDENIYLGIVNKNYEFCKEKNNDPSYPHTIGVEWVKVINRDDLSLNLRASLRAWQTIANLDKHTKEIKQLIENKVEKRKTIKFITGSYPLRENLEIKYSLPSDITKTEAERYGSFIKTLYYMED